MPQPPYHPTDYAEMKRRAEAVIADLRAILFHGIETGRAYEHAADLEFSGSSQSSDHTKAAREAAKEWKNRVNVLMDNLSTAGKVSGIKPPR